MRAVYQTLQLSQDSMARNVEGASPRWLHLLASLKRVAVHLIYLVVVSARNISIQSKHFMLVTFGTILLHYNLFLNSQFIFCKNESGISKILHNMKAGEKNEVC